MLSLSLGYQPRASGGGQPPPPPVRQVTLVSAAGAVLASASGPAGTGLVFDLTAAPFAGRYTVDPASLSGGPVSLVAPVLRDPDGKGVLLTADPGLWAVDGALPAPVFSRAWQADGTALAGQSAATLSVDASLSGKAVTCAEILTHGTAPGAVGAQRLSAAWAVPVWLTGIVTVPGAPVTLRFPPGQPATVTLTQPADLAGSYPVDPAQMAQGAIVLRAPRITGTGTVGQVLTASGGLYLHDPGNGALQSAGSWLADGAPLAATGMSCTLDAATAGRAITWRETLSQTAGGVTLTRTALSNAITVAQAAPQRDSFTVPDGTKLMGYQGESGIPWTSAENLATVYAGVLRPTAASAPYLQPRGDAVAADQFAQARFVMRSGTATGNTGMGIAVRINARQSGYQVFYNGVRWYLVRLDAGVSTVLATFDVTYAAAQEVDVRIEAQGTAVRLILDGTLVRTAQDATYAGGGVGVRAQGNNSTSAYPGLTDFIAGAL